MRFCSLAPHLFSELGHGVAYQNALYEVAIKKGVFFSLLTPKKTALKGLKIKPSVYFSRKPFFRLFQYITLFTTSCEKTLFFIESFTSWDLFFLFLALPFLKRRDRFYFLFRRNFPFLSLLCRYKKMRGLTDSALIAKEYSFKLLPIPHTFKSEKMKKSSSKIICYWPGEPRVSKGLLEMQKIAPLCDLKKFALYASEEAKLASCYPVKAILSEKEYRCLFNACDIILLPYDPVIYKVGTSGIFVEAVCLGKMPIVKSGSWLSYELKNHNLSELILDFNERAFFEKIESLFHSHETREKLYLMKEVYQKFHNKKNFCELLSRFVFLT